MCKDWGCKENTSQMKPIFLAIVAGLNLIFIPMQAQESYCITANGDIPCSQARLTKWGKICVPINQTNGGLWSCISHKAGASFEKAKGMVWEQK